MFVDRTQVHARAGNGGAGVAAFVRAKGKPQGKPTGGNGGDGGDVVIRADEGVSTLLAYRRHPHHKAGSGSHGTGDFQHGRAGEDLILPVPPGTTIYDESGRMVADLVEPGQQVVVLIGGRGGRGNAAFVSPKRRAPSICEQGEYGAEESFTLELKLMADAALVGFPNAGKSTFIASVSAARPKIADYPFTTLEPNLGVVALDDREFVLADIPGLIEGAAEGKGLGHEFLRHTERAQVLVILLDPAITATHPVTVQRDVLLRELGAFSPELADRPHVFAVTKADLPEASEAAESIAEAHLISSLTGEGVNDLLYAIGGLIDQAERARPEREGYVLHRPVRPQFSVERSGNVWVVEGIGAQRAVRFAD
ncbi:MAG: GTPase ObgE, partial [Acidimicrobiia bacterium]|nr:GTPase ObgE [Acidimicrobiia bacterium]